MIRMSLSLHTIAPKSGARTKSFRVGRGPGTGRGKTAGRGTKGQRARTGGRKRLALKGMKQMLLGFPKNRGFRSLQEKPATIPLTRLAQLPEGVVTMETLKEAHLLPRRAKGAKIVGVGPATKKWMCKGLGASVGAKAAIEKAGGSIA